MKYEVQYERAGTALIMLVSCPSSLPDHRVDAARSELLARPQCIRTGAFAASYLLGLEQASAVDFPHVHALLKSLYRDVVVASKSICDGAPEAFSLSFAKIATGSPPKKDRGIFYEGCHLDSHPGLTEDTELLRVLINLSHTHRVFQFARTDHFALKAQGVETGRTQFKELALPGNTTYSSISLPGRTPAGIHALLFWASIVPHVGINTDAGYFLVSFETLRPFQQFGKCVD